MRLNFSSYNRAVAWLLIFHVCVFAVFPLSGALADEESIPDVVIGTGDAVSVGDVQNEVNTTEAQSAAPNDVSVSNENTAAVENALGVSSATGLNEASENGGTVEIATGDAVSLASVTNIVNTNTINSNGLFLMLSNLAGDVNGIDLRELGIFGTTNQTQSPCENICGTSGDLNVENGNDAAIANNVVVRSSTGENEASGNGGASILTGDAYAVADVMNVANTNIVDSNYLLFTFNNFGSWDGDIVFPPASFFEQIFGDGIRGARQAAIGNMNTANVSNNVAAEATTGSNEANGSADGGGVIQTGNANAGVNVVNEVNQNIFGGATFSVLFRIAGNWSGNVFGLPEGILWEETPFGIRFYEDPFMSGNGGSSSGALDIKNHNTAQIDNNVKVFALTGNNKVNNNNTLGTVATGDAFAVANIMNIANTNVVSSNWISAIVNVMGNWTGNISFGRPDLWVAADAKVARNPLAPNDRIAYNFTVTNNGDAAATNVRFTDRFNPKHLTSGISNRPSRVDDGRAVWDLGTIPPGGSVRISYDASVVPNIPFGETELTNNFSATSYETDQNTNDNFDAITLLAFNLAPWRGPIINDGMPELRIAKRDSVNPWTINTNSVVDYTVVISNQSVSWPAYDAVLTDVLKGPRGNIINSQSWDLGKIYPSEEITVTYSALFPLGITPGVYTNTATLTALGGGNPIYSYDLDPVVAVDSIRIVAPPRESNITNAPPPQEPASPAIKRQIPTPAEPESNMSAAETRNKTAAAVAAYMAKHRAKTTQTIVASAQPLPLPIQVIPEIFVENPEHLRWFFFSSFMGMFSFYLHSMRASLFALL